MKVLIADDHPVVREGLKQILSKRKDIKVTGEAENCHDVLKKASEDNYDLVLLDVKMPGRLGIDIIEELKNKSPGLSVLMLSNYPEEQYAIIALRSGASGYIVKDSAPDELLDAIDAVKKGNKYISSSMAQVLASHLAANGNDLPHKKLSGREYQVMMMIVSGKSLVKISDELNVSDKSVSTFRTRMLNKMNMKNNIELIRYAIKHGLTEE